MKTIAYQTGTGIVIGKYTCPEGHTGNIEEKIDEYYDDENNIITADYYIREYCFMCGLIERYSDGHRENKPSDLLYQILKSQGKI